MNHCPDTSILLLKYKKIHTFGVVSLKRFLIPAERMLLIFLTPTLKYGRNEVQLESHPLDSTMDPPQWCVVTFITLEPVMGKLFTILFTNYN